MTFVAVECFVVDQAKKFERPSMIFRYYCGKHLGTFFDFFPVLFVFLSFTVMVAGAGAVFEEHYGLSKHIGGIGLAAVVGILGIVRNPGGIAAGNALLPQLDLTQASTNWFMTGLSYVGFCMLWLAAFLAALGKTAHSRKEAASGGLLGGVVFSVACVVVGQGLLANIERVNGTEIPMLVLAGIYTTAIPLLWTVSSRF